MTRPLRIGLLGAAKIAPPAVIAPAKATGLAEVAAVAARDRGRAEAFAAEHGIAAVADDYEALIADPSIEAIYNGLPPVRHADLTIAALRAGKPVLCEKPFCMNAAEAEQMVAAASETGQLLMEAFHYRYHPFFERVLEIVGEGEIGPIRRIEAVFHASIPETPGEIRYDDTIGGGALMDLGTYPVHWCRTVMGQEPAVTAASALINTSGVDISTKATLTFASGAVADISCDMAAPVDVRLVLEGERGRLTAVNPLAPQRGHYLEVEGERPRRETVTRDPTYDFQLRAFVAAVRGEGAPLTGGADAVAQMRVLDEIRRLSRAKDGE